MDLTPILQALLYTAVFGPIVFLAVRHARRTPEQRRQARQRASRQDDDPFLFF